MKRRVAMVLVGSLAFIAAAPARAEESPAREAEEAPRRSYTIEQAVTDSLANHPRIRASVAEEGAFEARIDETRTRRLPNVGVSAQLNRSTGNTVPGAFAPLAGFVPVAGPVRGKTLDDGVWESGASLWGTWDVLAVTRQAAAVDAALAGRSEAAALSAARRLEVAYRAADAFLVLLAAEEGARAARASVERAQVLATVTKSLVDQTLRPGADAARADAELAGARTALARAEQGVEMRRAQLAEAVGNPSLRVEASPGALLAPVNGIAARATTAPSPGQPDIAVGDAAIARAAQAVRLVDVEYLPRVDFVAALWTRGSGLFQSPASGLVPDTANWMAGVNVTWSLLDIPALRARARVADASHAVAVAKRDEVALAVAGQLATSTAVLRGSLNVARQTPAALASARVAEQQAAARFKTGLSPVVDVADAQRLLAQAEIDEAVARLEVRRALLLLARASGDLGPFFAQSRSGEP